MKFSSFFHTLVTAALFAPGSNAQTPTADGTCTCYGDILTGGRKLTSLPEGGGVTRTLREVRQVQENIRALQTLKSGKGAGKGTGTGKGVGKGAGKKGGKKAGKKGGKKASLDDDLVETYCECHEVCDVSVLILVLRQ